MFLNRKWRTVWISALRFPQIQETSVFVYPHQHWRSLCCVRCGSCTAWKTRRCSPRRYVTGGGSSDAQIRLQNEHCRCPVPPAPPRATKWCCVLIGCCRWGSGWTHCWRRRSIGGRACSGIWGHCRGGSGLCLRILWFLSENTKEMNAAEKSSQKKGEQGSALGASVCLLSLWAGCWLKISVVSEP